VQIFATGGGDTHPSLAPGEAAPANGDPPVYTNVFPAVFIGQIAGTPVVGLGARAPAEVLFSGLAPGLVGVWQINARVPQNISPGSATVSVQVGKYGLSNGVTIAIQ
jgi:uncharacterized protein (TIGR03437 family)